MRDQAAVQVLVDAEVDALEEQVEVALELLVADAHGRRVDNGPRARQGGVDLRVLVGAWPPFVEQGFGAVPVGVAARGERLADAGGPETDADVGLAAHGVGELDEATVFFGDDERAAAAAVASGGRGHRGSAAPRETSSPPGGPRRGGGPGVARAA